jgi:hypothetical protein
MMRLGLHVCIEIYNSKNEGVPYIDGLNVFAVAENDINKLVNGNILADQDLGVEDLYFHSESKDNEPVNFHSQESAFSSLSSLKLCSASAKRTYCSHEECGRPSFPSMW